MKLGFMPCGRLAAVIRSYISGFFMVLLPIPGPSARREETAPKGRNRAAMGAVEKARPLTERAYKGPENAAKRSLL